MKYAAIPQELQERNNWLLWRSQTLDNGKKTKIPYQCNGYPASVTNPSHWASFACAVDCAGDYDGIGFVFGADDPYCGIDIDNANKHPNPEWQLKRQLQVFERFQSYTERSPSGEGCHIIIKADIGKGVRDGALEIYSQERYLTFTGDVIRDLPINDYQELALALKGDLRPDDAELLTYDEPAQSRSDDDVLASCRAATNSQLFHDLWAGSDAHHAGDTSRGDLALMNFIAFHSRNKAQSHRLFMQSERGKRDKCHKHKGYVPGLIGKAFIALPTDYDVSMIDWSAFQMQTAPEADGDTPEAASDQTGIGIPAVLTVQADESRDDLMDRIARDFKYEAPSGLLKDIADFIYSQAPRPVNEIALGGAISLMAGICGQAFNVSNTGLNQYILILAGTGTGKEAANAGINKLIQAVSVKSPTAREFLGPSQIASQQALIAYLDKNPCFLSVIGEFGLQLQQMSGPNAQPNNVGLRSILLKLYNMSGNSDTFQPMIYADPAKNTQVLYAPNFSMMGESTPERFYEALTEDMIYEGFLPRFSIIEYKGDRPYPNRNHATAQPSAALVEAVASLCAGAKASMASRAVTTVNFADDALQMFYDFGAYGDDKQRGNVTEFTKSLWSRTDVKAMKMAALVAIGRNYTKPVITLDAAEWAIGMALNDIRSLERKFLDGEVGRSNMTSIEQKQIDAVIRAISQWLHNPYEEYASKGGTKEMHDAHMIVAENVSKRVLSQAYFDKDRFGGGKALDATFRTLCDWGYLEEANKAEVKKAFGHARRTFAIIDKVKFPVELSKKGEPGRKF